MYDPTDIVDELNRKTIDAIQSCSNSYNSGQITIDQFRASIVAIWNCVGGLVHEEISETIASITQALAPRKMKRINGWIDKDGNSLVLFIWNVNSDKYTKLVFGLAKGKVARKDVEFGSAEEASAGYNLAVEDVAKISNLKKLFGDSE